MKVLLEYEYVQRMRCVVEAESVAKAKEGYVFGDAEILDQLEDEVEIDGGHGDVISARELT